METILDVSEFDTDGMTPRDCARDEGSHEFACYAEAVLAADEYRAWAKARPSTSYPCNRSDAADFPVVEQHQARGLLECPAVIPARGRASCDYNRSGGTDLRCPSVGYGCGMVGGLLVRGEYPAMRRAVARAIESGITYFDTAPLYGDGQSEVNLGAVLRELGARIVVGTKVRLAAADLDRIEAAIIDSAEASLRRLGRDAVDLYQLHNLFTDRRQPDQASLTPDDLPVVLRAFETLHRQGKIRFWGITALGNTEALHRVVDTGGFHTLQTVYNLLNPSGGRPVRADFPYQDFRQLIDRAAANRIGVIAIRVLAGGALSGTLDRHPIAMPGVAPLATGQDYAEDAARAHAFDFLVAEGIVGSLVEAAIRFALSKPEISTAMIGTASLDQFDQAVAAANRGPLPAAALERLTRIHPGPA